MKATTVSRAIDATPSYVPTLTTSWRERAAILTEYGAAAQAAALLKCAADLEAADREHWLEGLTLEAARAESGHSYSSLQKKVASGELTNIGVKGDPLVLRGELPKKGRSAQPVSIADMVLARAGQ